MCKDETTKENTKENFVARYSAIYEHSPWVAERVEPLLGDVGQSESDAIDHETLARLMADCVDNASRERQLALINAHPDLAGKAQLRGELTDDSTSEQASAGLDQCSAQELESFHVLNSAYKEKFGFPFIMAVRESNRQEILAAFESRLSNAYDAEFETALQEIHTIARLRLRALQEAS